MILFGYSNYFCKFHSFRFLDNWITSLVHICHAFLIQSPAEGQIGWLHSHVNRTPENTGVWVSLWQHSVFGMSWGKGHLGCMLISYPFATSTDPGLISIVIALVSTLPTVDTWPAHSTASPVSCFLLHSHSAGVRRSLRLLLNFPDINGTTVSLEMFNLLSH